LKNLQELELIHKTLIDQHEESELRDIKSRYFNEQKDYQELYLNERKKIFMESEKIVYSLKIRNLTFILNEEMNCLIRAQVLQGEMFNKLKNSLSIQQDEIKFNHLDHYNKIFVQKKKNARKKYNKYSKVKNNSTLEFLEYKEYITNLDEEKSQAETKLISLIDEGFKNSYLELELKRSTLIDQHCIELYVKQFEFQRQHISLSGIHSMNLLDHEYQHEAEKYKILKKFFNDIFELDKTQSIEILKELDNKSEKLEKEVNKKIKKIEKKKKKNKRKTIRYRRRFIKIQIKHRSKTNRL